jgi:hypothetical protein
MVVESLAFGLAWEKGPRSRPGLGSALVRVATVISINKATQAGLERNPTVSKDPQTNSTPNCDVVSSGTIADGLSKIVAQNFEVLIIDLHTQLADNRSTLVNAMRTFQPECLLVAVSDSFNLREATMAISLQADVIVKSSNMKQVVELIYTQEIEPALLY